MKLIKKRPCKICHKWFKPHPKAGDRQHVCSDPACQRERHRKSCEEWRNKNPDYDKENHLQIKIQNEREKIESGKNTSIDPVQTIELLTTVRDAVGLEVHVIINEITKVLVSWVRDAVVLQQPVIIKKYGKQVINSSRDEIDNNNHVP